MSSERSSPDWYAALRSDCIRPRLIRRHAKHQTPPDTILRFDGGLGRGIVAEP